MCFDGKLACAYVVWEMGKSRDERRDAYNNAKAKEESDACPISKWLRLADKVKVHT